MLSVLVTTLGVVIVVTDVAFAAQQERDQGRRLVRELERVARVVSQGEIGSNLLSEDADSFRLQFVSTNGQVVIPAGDAMPLPLVSEPTSFGDHKGLEGAWLVASVPWRLGSGVEAGTLRGAISLSGLIRARRDLRVALVSIGVLGFAVAGAASLVALRRSLAPLTDLARRVTFLDPGDPRFARYDGPDDEVGKVATALGTSIDAIRERREVERERLADVAHELAAPLTVVHGHLDEVDRRLEARARDDDVVTPRIRAARAAADDLMHVSQDLLTLARGDLGERMRWEVVDLVKLVEEQQRAYPALGVSTDAQSGMGRAFDARVLADEVRVRQVLRNVIRNAERAAGAVEKVHVHVGNVMTPEGDERVLTRIEDEGPGFGEEELERLFERYHTRTGGTGLGLAVVRRLVERMGGTVVARNRDVGQGAAFEILFPSWRALIEDGETEEGAKNSSSRPS